VEHGVRFHWSVRSSCGDEWAVAATGHGGGGWQNHAYRNQALT
jgi:hypothetical protein